MALSAATVLEIRNTADWSLASDTNGGGFVTGASGTDWSYASIPANGGPQYSVTDGVTAGTTTITSATAAFGTDVVGNLISVSGGTGSVVQNWYQIISRTNATTIVVDRSTGLTAGTGVTLKIGGALATPGGLGAVLAMVGVSGMRAWLKYSATAFTITGSTANVSGGLFVMPASVSISLEGYDQVRGDRTGNRPQMAWPSTGLTIGSITYLLSVSGNARQAFTNVLANGNSVNNVGGFSINNSTQQSCTGCVAENFNGTAGVGFLGPALGSTGCISCLATSCLTGFSLVNCAYCWATLCTTVGFANSFFYAKCIANLCGNGFSSNVYGAIYEQCTADSNTVSGFVLGRTAQLCNCLSTNHTGGSGFGYATTLNGNTLTNCAAYNNTTDITTGASGPITNEGFIPTASFTGGQPYTVAGSDFRPNNTAGAGALLRNAGIGVFGQTDNVDIGAVQHSDPSGGGGGILVNPGMRGGTN